MHHTRLQCRHFPSESLASDTEIFSFDNRDPVCLKPCPGCSWRTIKCMTSLISTQVEQLSRCRLLVRYKLRLGMQKQADLSDSSAKGIQLQHPSFRCIPLFWSPQTSVRSEVIIIAHHTSVQDILSGCQVLITVNAELSNITNLCAL